LNKFRENNDIAQPAYGPIYEIADYYKELLTQSTDEVARFMIHLEKAILLDYIAHGVNGELLETPHYGGKFERGMLMKYFISEESLRNQIHDFMEEIETLIRNSFIRTETFLCWIDLEKLGEHRFKHLTEQLLKIKLWDSNYLSFSFSHDISRISEFSSGDMSILGMLARFYSRKQDEIRFKNLEIDRFATIIIDEGELYLHPAWQKKLVSILVSTLPIIFRNSKLQLILTSHSPFVLSDIPKNNVIFLTTNSDSTQDSSDILQHQQTLAANIHTLLADTFFMEDGFIGNYAKMKIDTVISDLKGNATISVARKTEIKKTIMAIGEPIIQRKLLELYDIKFSIGLEERVSNMEKRLGL